MVDDLQHSPFARQVVLESVRVRSNAVHIGWSVDGIPFSTSYRYSDVDFDDLREIYGSDTIEKIGLHIALFEVNKGMSLGATDFIVSDPLSHHLTDELIELWTQCADHIWAQWRYEHGYPLDLIPVLRGESRPSECRTSRLSDSSPGPPIARRRSSRRDEGAVGALWFCGGGKDSLLSRKIMDDLQVPRASLVYAHDLYGSLASQFDLIDPVASSPFQARQHRIVMTDDLLKLPVEFVQRYFPAVDYVLAGETPSSLFASIPVALAHGYTDAIVGHERSADDPQLCIGDRCINHQWGKSFHAERILRSYIREKLVRDYTYYSILSDVYDPLIFYCLREVGESIAAAHSCNIEKPWCYRCAKCVYVLVSYAGWLEPESTARVVTSSSGLFSAPENVKWARQLLGLEDHGAFECVGSVSDARLAFAMAYAKGIRGGFMAEFKPIWERVSFDQWLAMAGDRLEVKPSRMSVSSVSEAAREWFQARAPAALRYFAEIVKQGRRDDGLE